MNSNVKQLRTNLKEILEGLQKFHRASTHREITVGIKKISVPTHIGTLHFIVETNPVLNIGVIEVNYAGKWEYKKEHDENLFVRKINSSINKNYLEPLSEINKWKGYIIHYKSGLFYQLDNFLPKDIDSKEKNFAQYVLWNTKDFRLIKKTKLLNKYIEQVNEKVELIKELREQFTLLDLPSEDEQIASMFYSGHHFVFCGNKIKLDFLPNFNYLVIEKDEKKKKINFEIDSIINEFEQIKLESQVLIKVDEPKENFIRLATNLFFGWARYEALSDENKEKIQGLYRQMNSVVNDWYLLEEVALKFHHLIQKKESLVSLQRKDGNTSLVTYRVNSDDIFYFLNIVNKDEETFVEFFSSDDEKDNRINNFIIKYLGI